MTTSEPEELPSLKQIETKLIFKWSDEVYDVRNPIHWSTLQRWILTSILLSMSYFTLTLGSYHGSMKKEESKLIKGPLDTILSSTSGYIFGLGAASSPLLLSPFSEAKGRLLVLRAGSLVLATFNFASSLVKSQEQLFVMRFLAGLGAGAPLSTSQAIMSDIWRQAERKRPMALQSLITIIGPTTGSLLGTLFRSRLEVKCMFWSSVAISIIHCLSCFIFLSETYPPIAIQREANLLQKSLMKSLPHQVIKLDLSYPFMNCIPPVSLYHKYIPRPLRLYITEPMALVLSLYLGILYSLFYIILNLVRHPSSDSGYSTLTYQCLKYICLLLGASIGSQISTRRLGQTCDYLRLTKSEPDLLEYRFRCMLPGIIIILPSGLLLYALSSHHHVTQLFSSLGLILIGGGMIMSGRTCSSYLLKVYHLHSASATAAVAFPRRALSFIFAVEGNRLVSSLGFQTTTVLITIISLTLVLPSAILIWEFGGTLRRAGTFH